MSKTEWTRELPTKPGYYYVSWHRPAGRWAWGPSDPPTAPSIVTINLYSNELEVETPQGAEDLEMFTTEKDLSGVSHRVVLWMGPIELPDSPEPQP